MSPAPAIQLQPLLFSHYRSFSSLPFSFQSQSLHQCRRKITPISVSNKFGVRNSRLAKFSVVRSSFKGSEVNRRRCGDGDDDDDEGNGLVRIMLWILEGVYILWLFLLPYAPGDPAWAISRHTINSIVGLSLNFFFILPLSNAVGSHLMEAPVLHPMSEGLFNFVVGWTFMFAPLLYTDHRRDRYKGSLDVLWGLQAFLTNTFLIPYMAIRLNPANEGRYPKNPTKLGTVMIKGASTVGLICGGVCLISILWALWGRMDGGFGNLNDRWDFLLSYLGSERLAYAFIWDIILYTIFQPWLIGENLPNVKEDQLDVVKYLRYVPVVGLGAYLLCLKTDIKLYMVSKYSND